MRGPGLFVWFKYVENRNLYFLMVVYSMYMNTNIKIILSVLLLVVALYGAYQFGQSVSVSTPVDQNATSTVATSTATSSISTKEMPTTVKPVSTVKPTTSNTLVKIDYRGGVCPNGKICATTKVITKDAVYYKDGVKVSNVNKNDVAKIKIEMEKMDWVQLKSKVKTTGCDLERVQEIVYTFYTSKGLQAISNCQHDFDVTLPLFRTIAVMLPQ